MKSPAVVFSSILITAILLITSGCGEKKDENKLHQHEMTSESASEIVRDFDVEVAFLDENEDGKLFQCPMDWQVISDEDGKCPLCNMKLKEYSVEDAQTNLTEYKQLMQ